MKSLPIVAATVLVAGLTCSLQAGEQKADNKTLIVGVWELTKAGDGGPPLGTTLEFTKGGNLKMRGKADGKEFVFEGTYIVEGNKLTHMLKILDRDEKDTTTIKKLTNKELVMDNEVRVLEFKRKK